MLGTEQIPMNPLARADCSAVRAGQITQDSPARQLTDGMFYIQQHGVSGTPPNMLRVVAALAETVAELKTESSEKSR
jgi:hypothetical protein